MTTPFVGQNVALQNLTLEYNVEKLRGKSRGTIWLIVSPRMLLRGKSVTDNYTRTRGTNWTFR